MWSGLGIHAIAPILAEVVSSPFEISDEGWGEFESSIELDLHDDACAPIRFAHQLKIFPPAQQSASHPPDAPIVSEFYDELVFNQPHTLSTSFRERVRTFLELPTTPLDSHHLGHFFREYTAEPDLAQIAAAQAFVAQETARLMERLARADGEAAQLREDLEMLGWSTGKPYESSVGSGDGHGSAGPSSAAAASSSTSSSSSSLSMGATPSLILSSGSGVHHRSGGAMGLMHAQHSATAAAPPTPSAVGGGASAFPVARAPPSHLTVAGSAASRPVLGATSTPRG